MDVLEEVPLALGRVARRLDLGRWVNGDCLYIP